MNINDDVGKECRSFRSHYEDLNLFLDPIYEYIVFTKPRGGETSEQDLIDSEWVQRLRRIHQLQSAWWVFPSAEHSRFQHAIGVMHLAGNFAQHLYTFLEDMSQGNKVEDLPGRDKFVETARMAGLLHDVGHGPFGHFLDTKYLIPKLKTNHELIGQNIVRTQLKPLIEGIRRSPWGDFNNEQLAADDIAYLIKKPDETGIDTRPDWLRLMRMLFAGIYSADNLDYVCRDAYMTGVCKDAVDISRLMYYTHVRRNSNGELIVALHRNGVSTLQRFLQTRFFMHESIYNHRTVRAIEIEMERVFEKTVDRILKGNLCDDLTRYLNLDDWSLISRANELARKDNSDLGKSWRAIIDRNPRWQEAFCAGVKRRDPPGILDFKNEKDRIYRENMWRDAIFEKVQQVIGSGINKEDIRVDIVILDLRPEEPFVQVYDPLTKTLVSEPWDVISGGIPTRSYIIRAYTSQPNFISQVTEAAEAVIGRQRGQGAFETNI